MENRQDWMEVLKSMMAEMGDTKTLTTTTENGAIVPFSTGDVLVDQFGRAGTYRNRNFSDVSRDMECIWEASPLFAMRFIFYLRMITRVIRLANGKETEKVQKGQGARDEAFKRLIWVAENHPDIFYRNSWLIPLVGSWKDIWTILTMAKMEGAKVSDNILFTLLGEGLKSESQRDLVLKYLPRIKTKSGIKTERTRILTHFAKRFADFLGLTPRQYNKMKSSGKGHVFQQLITKKEFDKLNWSHIPGIALGRLTETKFFQNQGLEENFFDWLSKQNTVKFNGYPYDLLTKLTKKAKHDYFGYGGGAYSLLSGGIESVSPILRKTVDLQFDNLIATIERDGKFKENTLCALDTSGSMSSGPNPRIAPLDICVSLGVYFSTLNQGNFHKKVMMFDSHSEFKQLEGSFSEMVGQLPRNAMGSTNFMSIIESLAQFRENNPTIPLEEYPTTILVVSDMQFDPHRRRWGSRGLVQEENKDYYTKMKDFLYEKFPKEYVDSIKFIWWNVNGSHDNMPATLDNGGCYFMSGFDGAIVSLLMNQEDTPEKEKVQKSMEDVINEALTQEVLTLVTVE